MKFIYQLNVVEHSCVYLVVGGEHHTSQNGLVIQYGRKWNVSTTSLVPAASSIVVEV